MFLLPTSCALTINLDVSNFFVIAVSVRSIFGFIPVNSNVPGSVLKKKINSRLKLGLLFPQEKGNEAECTDRTRDK